MKRRPSPHSTFFATLALGFLALPSSGLATTVTGLVVDGTTGLPLGGVQLFADGQFTGSATDAAGKFSAELTPGEKALDLKKDGFSTQNLGKVEVAAQGEQALPNAKLYSTAGSDVVMLDALSVEGQVLQNSVVAARQNADVSVDLITAADFGKFTGTDVADIIVRVPGLSTTSQGSFAVVRGLAERYNPVMLDGIVLPSSDPERQSPALDIFPTRLVDAVVVSKTYEPQLPATSSGGAIDLRSKPLPEGRFIQLQVGLRADEGAVNNDEFRSYSNIKGNRDEFALGSAARPSAPLPTFPALNSIIGNTAANPLASKSADFSLGKKFGVIVEDLFSFNDNGRALGYTFNFGYDSSYTAETGQKLALPSFFSTNGAYTRTLPQTGVSPSAYESSDYAEYVEEVRLSGLANIGYAFNQKHSVSASLYLSQIGLDTVTQNFNSFTVRDSDKSNLKAIRNFLAEGDRRSAYLLSDADQGPLRGSDELQYQERNLTNAKISGIHKFGVNEATDLSWTVANIHASQNEPYFRKLTYFEFVDPLNVSTFSPGLAATGSISGTSRVYWRETEADTLAYRLDGKHKFDLGKIEDVEFKAGGYLESSERTTTEVGAFLNNGASLTPNGPSLESVSNSLNGVTFFLTPFTGNSNANRDLTSFHGSITLPLLKDRPAINKLDIMFGARVEDFSQVVSGQANLGSSGTTGFYESSLGGPLRVADILGINRDYDGNGIVNGLDSTFFGQLKGQIEEVTVHPALALNYSPVKRFNVRLSASQTIARPSYREVGPYFTQDQITDETQVGNIGLKTSEVNNYDLRLEYFFPESKDLVAFSVFNKSVGSPIEKISPRTDFPADPDVVTWANNPSDAQIYGAEFEISKNLGFVLEPLKRFTLGLNATYINAKVSRVPGLENLAIANLGDERRLFDQPEYILNAYTTYEHVESGLAMTLAYFSISDVLQTVQQDAWDRYVDAYDRWDLSISKRFGKHWKVSLSARNLLDPERLVIADPEATRETIVYRSYNDGRSYTVTMTYDF